VRVVAHDVFPPSVPAGLQAAYSGEGQKPFIDLVWAPVTNADLAGYNVYRSEANGAEVKMMVKLNSELVKSPSYRDSAVASGKTYTYSVSAVDVRGNESQRSEETSESVP
jgi:fibronectin type 3 domain-containing protein